MAVSKGLELDVRLQALIDEEFAKYEVYLTSPQEVAQYRRKRKEFWDNVNARLREVKEANTNGRADAGNN